MGGLRDQIKSGLLRDLHAAIWIDAKGTARCTPALHRSLDRFLTANGSY
jgi:hypothetical protein